MPFSQRQWPWAEKAAKLKRLVGLAGWRARLRSGNQPHLTDRDRAILQFLFDGLANKEIAANLGISEGAVKSSISQYSKSWTCGRERNW